SSTTLPAKRAFPRACAIADVAIIARAMIITAVRTGLAKRTAFIDLSLRRAPPGRSPCVQARRLPIRKSFNETPIVDWNARKRYAGPAEQRRVRCSGSYLAKRS